MVTEAQETPDVAAERRAMPDTREMQRRMRHRPLGYVAVWQVLGFFMLLCLIWVNELIDLPAAALNVTPSKFDLLRPIALSIGIVLCGVITVGNTYLQQRSIIAGMLVVCSHCRKVRIGKDAWQEMERFVMTRSKAVLSHGLCPDCYQTVIKNLDKAMPRTDGQAAARSPSTPT